MSNTQTVFSIGIYILFFMAIAGTGFSAKVLLTQDDANPISNRMTQTYWTVPSALWVVYGLARWSTCW